MRGVLIALCAIFAVSTARVVITAQGQGSPHLLGTEECTWGPSYWCENLKTAAGCNATKHCIKASWEKMTVPEDNDSVCGICKDMVQQARDQLESNQTMEDLKAVFDGSCMLIHVKPIVKECIKLVDQFIPDLVETLASQMNPSVVCSVAGLCNSAHFDKLLEKYQEPTTKVNEMKFHSLENDELVPDDCSKCYTVATHMEYKLNTASRDNVLEQMLNRCAELGTFTDACSSIILNYFDTIYSHLQENFKAPNICHLSGQCAAKFHKHEGDMDEAPKVEIRPLSSVGVVDIGDDLPCKLCEQLVGHLRDLLVANTTETEFQQVLEGLCKQTKSFSTECTAIVDEYYPQIYEYLIHGLDSNIVCQMSGICPSPGKTVQEAPMWPLLPVKQSEVAVRLFKGADKNVANKGEAEAMKLEIEEMQLPIERLLPFPALGTEHVSGKETCALCEYILHYVQEAITDPNTEEKVKEAIGKVCTKIPKSLKGECTEFVNSYGDAVVAILAQEIDPSQVCPMLHMCPSAEFTELIKSAPEGYVIEEEGQNKPSCPLCLLAVTQVYNVIKDNKTEANIEAQLDKLCTHLPHSLTDECADLVKGYSKELIELLLADLKPQEVCAYLKLCDTSKDIGPPNSFMADKHAEILTNEIPNVPQPIVRKREKGPEVTCVICEYVMQYVDKAMGNKNEKDKIEKIVHGVCNFLPKTISRECNNFVTQYADVVIDILSQDVSPKEVCSMMGLCKINTQQLQASVTECALCQAVISTVDKLLDNSKVDEEIEDAVSKACKYLPARKQGKCVDMVKIYGQSIINLFKQYADPKTICSEIALCTATDYLALSWQNARTRRSYGSMDAKRCTWGPSYWCATKDNARECKAVHHCEEHVWKTESTSARKQITLSEEESTNA